MSFRIVKLTEPITLQFTGGINWEGAWSAVTDYVTGDGVSNGGSSYVCILNHTDHEPPNATYWDLLAQAGGVGIASVPEAGEYKVTGIRMSADHKLIITYDTTPE